MIRHTINACLIKTFNNFHITKARSVHRWVGPTLREIRRRKEKMGPQPPEPRSGFVEWNYRAELFSFSKRLHEEFKLPLLQTAFTQRSYILQEEKKQRDLGIEEVDIKLTDNNALAEQGKHLSKEYVQAYLQHSLPKVPADGQKALTEYLLSQEMLAYVSTHLGTKELIFSAEYPPSPESLANSLLAVIGALAESSGAERAFLFVRDFICTQLNQRDLSELWLIEEPEKRLQKLCEDRKLGVLEPRLIGDCAKNTVLAAYHVGVYANKQLIGRGYGEDVNTAIKTASLDALHSLYGIQEHMRPLNFNLQVQSKHQTLQK